MLTSRSGPAPREDHAIPGLEPLKLEPLKNVGPPD